MPFTVSHVAAALPLRRLNLVWSAFVVGSMAPDFPYIVGTTEYRSLGHQFPGVIEFTLPASLFALWLFHAAIKRPAATLLPGGMQQRLHAELGDFKFGGPARFMAILFSMALGIATHVVWDAFTHPFSWPGGAGLGCNVGSNSAGGTHADVHGPAVREHRGRTGCAGDLGPALVSQAHRPQPAVGPRKPIPVPGLLLP